MNKVNGLLEARGAAELQTELTTKAQRTQSFLLFFVNFVPSWCDSFTREYF